MMTRSRRRMSETLGEDRLSSLPDELLTNGILSLLTTRESVSTSVLSTRWKHLFKYVPVLHFDPNETWNRDGFIRGAKLLNFMEFVNKLLLVHDVPSIQSFRLILFPCNHELHRLLNSWISAAIHRNPRLVEMKIWDAQNGTLNALLTSKMLVHLKLEGNFNFSNIGIVHLPALKTFNMRYCRFSDGDSVKRLFSGCPVLEVLTLFGILINGIKVISINSPLLKKLTIDSPKSVFSNIYEWELNVPNLESIYFELDKSELYSVTILKYLRKAHIALGYNFEDGDGYARLWGLINKFEEVQFLSLCGLSTKSLASDSISLPMFHKLTSLELRNFQNGWNLFPKLLERAPCLELLVIHEDGWSWKYNKEFPEVNILLLKDIPLCFSQFLKEVELCMFKREESKYEWVGLLLKNGKVLQKLTVTVPKYDEKHYAYLQRRCELKKKLLALPKASSTCQIVVRKE